MNYFELESERLRFREVSLEDVEKWKPFFEDNSGLPFLGIDLTKDKETLAKHWIQKQLYRYEEYQLGHLAVELKDSGKFIGMGGILPRELEGQKEYEIAYSLLPEFWGKGYAIEIARRLKQHGRDHIMASRFISIIHIENHASTKVAVKNGMSVISRTVYNGMDVHVYATDG